MPQPINELKYLSTRTHSILWCNAECCIFVDTHSSLYRVLYICPKRLKLSLKKCERQREKHRETGWEGRVESQSGKQRPKQTGGRTPGFPEEAHTLPDPAQQIQAYLSVSKESSSCGHHRNKAVHRGANPLPAAHLQLVHSGRCLVLHSRPQQAFELI